MNERYIAISNEDGLYGHYGTGASAEEAKNKLRKAGGKPKNCKVVKFTSELPFVPAKDKREAGPNEADAWVGRDGSVNWIRCERIWITP